MKHIYIPRTGDRELLIEFYKKFRTLSNQELIDSYNSSVDLGIVGAHAQGLHLIAERKVFMERFGKSPIKIEDNIIISLSKKIKLKSKNFKELK